jgi:hypothetical protein
VWFAAQMLDQKTDEIADVALIRLDGQNSCSASRAVWGVLMGGKVAPPR